MYVDTNRKTNPSQYSVFSFNKMATLVGNMNNKRLDTETPFLQSIDPNINNKSYNEKNTSVLLIDGEEDLQIRSEESFLKALNINSNDKVKVVSIFGNTGEGKSYTMNKVFFDGELCFKTSSSQDSCTLGVWAMYNPKLKVICLDTEGFLGISKRQQQRKRLLLKVMAISDVIIYRTRAERLPSDMYTFLSTASEAYKRHFSSALLKALSKTETEGFSGAVGPGVIIFHETRYTETLHDSANVSQSPEDILRDKFAASNLPFDAFSFLKYVGVKTGGQETSFKDLKVALTDKLESTEVRTKRDAKFVYLALKSLNEKFKNVISDSTPQLYLSNFFTCTDKCQSCSSNCNLSVGHKDEGEAHHTVKNCTFQEQYGNSVLLCKACYKNGRRTIVKQEAVNSSLSSLLTYVWSGYVIDCPKCGEIYRSRQYWYDNKNPEDSGACIIEVVHIWPGERALFGSQNSAQKVLDGVTLLTDVISTVGSQPTQIISDWAADKIAPSYWRPNNEIRECFKCKSPFHQSAQKHHCRSCGEGFCEACSSKCQPVPARGWLKDVRVCDNCFVDESPTLSNPGDGAENMARQIGETVLSSFSAVKSVLDIPRVYIKDSARPAYWMPDNSCIECWVCKQHFGPLRALHHCRECGKGVCDECSGSRKPVPLRGWHSPVRVCNLCR